MENVCNITEKWCFSMLTEDQVRLYQRNILLPGVGAEGQEKICSGKVLIVGAGGLGSAAALYCAAAGVGVIGIVDHDRVELSNLQRQILHTTESIGLWKTHSAKRTLAALNNSIRINAYQERLCAETASDILGNYDFVIDCTDNFQSKFFINDACVRSGLPFSHAGVLEFYGQTMTVLPGKSACYRCVFQNPPALALPPGGILGSVAGMLGAIQATEAIKFLIGKGDLLTDALLTVDTLSMEFRKVRVQKKVGCPACGIPCTVLPA
jgi:molybdopterin-synthase adenylyltransferase